MTPPPPHPRLHRHRRWIGRGVLLLWLAAFVATHWPAARMPPTGVSDKHLHLAGYFVLAGGLAMVLLAYHVRPAIRRGLLAAFLPLYAGLDEITQPLFNRYADLHDWGADLLGAALGVLAVESAALVARHRTARRQR